MAGAVGVFLTALVTHLLVILVVGSGHSGFGATFRIAAYSSVTSLAGRVPFVGWVFSLYRLYLATVGIREMHATTTGKALLVVLPAILVLVIGRGGGRVGHSVLQGRLRPTDLLE
jgi:hypothetical protein